MAATPGCILLYLLPSRTRALGGKAIQCWPQVDQQLIDGGAAGIQQPQGLGLEGVGQADGKGERLGPGHGLPPPAQLVCAQSPVVVVGFQLEPHAHRAELPLTIS